MSDNQMNGGNFGVVFDPLKKYEVVANLLRSYRFKTIILICRFQTFVVTYNNDDNNK